MSEGNAQAGVLYIAEKGSIAMMRVQGSGVRNLAEGFDKWIDYLPIQQLSVALSSIWRTARTWTARSWACSSSWRER